MLLMTILTAIENKSLLVSGLTRKLSYEKFVARIYFEDVIELAVIRPGYPIAIATIELFSESDFENFVKMQERLANSNVNISGHTFNIQPDGNSPVWLSQNGRKHIIDKTIYIANISQASTSLNN